MKQQNEFNSEHEKQHSAEQQTNQAAVREFAKPEDLLRHDTQRIPVPAAIAERLKVSSASFPKPSRSWWQRFFGK
ncbi:MAG TPA: hypothetical protein VKV04_16280 [Verrucomicrobiae bacterium]|nr:hypothetical protein [Verrucomicrobiae bacterium]